MSRSDVESAGEHDPWIDALLASPVASMLRPVDLEAGTQVARAGEEGRHFLIVLAGNATVTDASTGEEIAEIGPGSILGELALLTDGVRYRDVSVRSPLHGLVGDADAFERAMAVEAFRTHVGGCAARRLASSAQVVTAHDHTGHDVGLRPLLPSDRDAYMHAIEAASRQTLVNRFFSGAAPSRAIIDYLLDVDCVRHFAWVALDPPAPPEASKGVGVGRYIRDRDDPTTAEFAIAVAESHRRRGIAGLLLGALGVTAVESNVETFTANVLADNVPMRALLDEMGASWERAEPGVVRTAIPTTRFAALFDPEAVAALRASTETMISAARLALA